MSTNLRQPGFIHEQRPLPPSLSPSEYDGELWQGMVKDLTKSMSLGNPTPTEDEDEKPEPESSRDTCCMVDIKPDAQEALAKSEKRCGPKVVLVNGKYIHKFECAICNGEHMVMDCPQNEYKDNFDELLKVRQSLTPQDLIKKWGLKKQTDDSSTQVRNAKPIRRIKKTKKKSKVADCKGKTKAGGIADMCAAPPSRVVDVVRWPCRICEGNDHYISACPYKISIQPGEKVSSEAAILCTCCHQVGAHPDGSRVSYYAALKYCGYCHAVGQHKVKTYEDCPNVEDKERLDKITDEIAKNWGKK